MTSRSFRLETRSRARDEIKRITQTVDKVRRWEKKWVDLGQSNSLKVYKWVPVEENDAGQDEEKENQPMEITEQDEEAAVSRNQRRGGEPVLPVITPVQSGSAVGDSQLVVTEQTLPEMLLVSEENDEPSGSLSSSGASSGSKSAPPSDSKGPDGQTLGIQQPPHNLEVSQGDASSVPGSSTVSQDLSQLTEMVAEDLIEKMTEEQVESSVTRASGVDSRSSPAEEGVVMGTSASTKQPPQPPLLHNTAEDSTQKAYDLGQRLERPNRHSRDDRQSGSPASDIQPSQSRSRSRSPQF